MRKSNEKKAKQLGMPQGTAANRLRKSIIFSLVKRLQENYCYQCGAEIETENELSIEHKVPYLDSTDPVELYFSLDNIAYSHLSCNSGAARNANAERASHPSTKCYAKGCRCDGCKEANSNRMALYRKRRSIIFKERP